MEVNKTFLLVENNAHEVELLQELFKKVAPNIHLQVARDGLEAKDYLEKETAATGDRQHPHPELVLLDLHMPRMNGYQFLDWRQNQTPGDLGLIPVVVLSGTDDYKSIRQAYEKGANSYMVKPLRWDDFGKCVQTICTYWGTYVAKPFKISPIAEIS